jgi:hypothetical protein
VRDVPGSGPGAQLLHLVGRAQIALPRAAAVLFYPESTSRSESPSTETIFDAGRCSRAIWRSNQKLCRIGPTTLWRIASADISSYKEILGGRSQRPEFALPERFRIDVDAASDHQILAAVSLLIAEYIRSLDFIRDVAGSSMDRPTIDFFS